LKGLEPPTRYSADKFALNFRMGQQLHSGMADTAPEAGCPFVPIYVGS
jgi:hypothetical protein